VFTFERKTAAGTVDIDTVMVDGLKVLDPNGRLEKQTLRWAVANPVRAKTESKPDSAVLKKDDEIVRYRGDRW
jgi:hypothetical protein